MDESFESKYHRLEENHGWFRARRDMIYKIIKKLNINKNSQILEMGCSGGVLIKFLEQKGFYNIYGIDISKKAIALCKKKGMKNTFVMNGAKPKFNNKKFDIIIASDVLEHIKNDSKALSRWNKILKDKGKLIIFVPAFNFLWSGHDEINNHYRRYSKSELIKLLKRNRFEIERNSYWNFSLFFPISLIRILNPYKRKNNKRKKDQLYELNFLNKIILAILKFENYIIFHKINFPVGISIFAIARKMPMKKTT